MIEGIKDIQIKYLEDNTFIDLLLNDTYVERILSPVLVDNNNHHLYGNYTETLRFYRYKIASDSEQGRRIMLYLGKLICIYDKKTGSASVPYPIFVEIFLDKRLIAARAKSKAGM